MSYVSSSDTDSLERMKQSLLEQEIKNKQNSYKHNTLMNKRHRSRKEVLLASEKKELAAEKRKEKKRKEELRMGILGRIELLCNDIAILKQKGATKKLQSLMLQKESLEKQLKELLPC